MKNPAWRTLTLLCAVVLSMSVIAVAQQPKPTIKRVPIEVTSPASGEDMYVAYCAACHGKEGKGDGPAAPAFKTPPTDLTRLTATHNGKFPEDYVAMVLQNGPADTKAHGSKDMPVWGALFRSMDDGQMAHHRIYNLTKYIETLQPE